MTMEAGKVQEKQLMNISQTVKYGLILLIILQELLLNNKKKIKDLVIGQYIYILIVFLYESKMISLEMGPGTS